MQQLPPPDFAAIQAFVALADTGSFAAAGKMLGKDPTVLSRRIAALEERLGIRLAERSTRHVALTEAGRAYLARVRPLLHELETADRDAAAFADGEPRGHLRLSLPTTFSRMWLDPLIIAFARAHPLVSIEAEYSNNFAGLVGEAFDAAVRLGELADSRLIARKIGMRRRLLCAAPAYLARHDPIERPEDLLRHACLTFTGLRDPFRWAFKGPDGDPLAITVTGPLASDDADLLLAGALAGLGILYTTDWHVAPLLRRGTLVEILPDWPTVDRGAIYIVTPAAGGTPSKTRAFSDWIADGLNPAPWLAGRHGGT
ncbi:LysR family transcriptional regulator [Sphingomonas sp. ERG5]|uniref:LysR family transcriptional regulator n=1 Tax=Sphingomonas sp. ERG5 TaxID=1381597 RepID=UPI00054BC108|nr:LysR family transcriptional regulator [Sphingomonas sp. ERG5]